LPDEPPYVLPEDEKVLAFDRKGRGIHALELNLIPEPFVGRPDAPVLLLGNNPGVKGDESRNARQKPAFRDRMRDNLLHRLSPSFPFLFLDPDPGIASPGKGWWERKLKRLLDEFGPDEDAARRILARSVLAVEYFPYVSHRYRHRKLTLPSQGYSFGLVRNAMKRGAVIVLTRGRRRWERAVEELGTYPRCFRLVEVQRAPISPGNFPDRAQYEEIVRAIRDGQAVAPPG
jgi:hypothetical protein